MEGLSARSYHFWSGKGESDAFKLDSLDLKVPGRYFAGAGFGLGLGLGLGNRFRPSASANGERYRP